MKGITEFINEGKYSKKAINTTITKYVLWYVGCNDMDEFTSDSFYRENLQDCAEGNDEWTFGYHALKSQFGGSFDRMYNFLLAEMNKNTPITLAQSEFGHENVAIYFTLGDYVFDTTATGEFDGK
jgi:hypothetical protein